MTFEDIIAEMMGGASLGFADEAKGVMDGITAKMKDVNTPTNTTKGVMETPTPLPKPINVMRSEDTYDYDFGVDGNTEGYTFTGDAAPYSEAVAKMRAIQGITADGQMLPNTTNLGLGSDIGAAEETNFLNNTFVGQNDFAGTGEANMDVDRQSFNTNFANLTPEEKAKVTEMMAGMTDAQKKAFALGMTKGKVSGYELGEQYRLGY